MASVKSVSFTCPNCSKVLRASARPPAGKKIKCPACSEPFVPELDDEEAATKIQDKPRVKAKPAPSRSDDDDADEKPRNKKSRADEDDDDRPRKKRSRDDDEDDEDDRPSKKNKKKSGGKMMMIILAVVFLGGGGLLGCIGCGVGAWFFWPTGNNELAAYIAPDANLIIGGKPKELKTKFSGFKDMFQQAAGPGPNDRFPEMEDLILNSEQFLLFTNTNNLAMNGPVPTKGMVLIFKAEQADIDKIVKSNRLEAAKNVGGHSIHKIKADKGMGGGPDLLAISGRHVIFSDLEEGQLKTVLDRGKKSPASSSAIDLSRSVDRSPMWIAFTFDGNARKQLRDVVEMGGEKVPEMKAAGPAFDGAKGMTFTLDVVGANDLKMTTSIMCKNSTDAEKVKTGIEAGWKLVKGLMDGAMAFGGMQGPEAKAAELMVKDLGKMTFSTSGSNATATMTFSNQTIEELAKVGKNNPFMGGGFNPPPPKFDDGKKDFPKFDGIKKDFPKFDGIKDFGPKDFPKKDGFPKTKGKLIQTFTHLNINAGDKRESVIQLQQGKRVTVTMISTTKGIADVDLFVMSGAPGGGFVAGDSSVGPNGTAVFLVPQTGAYRIEVRNLGQGLASRSIVNVYEQ
jgi:phage FluMu protein Com